MDLERARERAGGGVQETAGSLQHRARLWSSRAGVHGEVTSSPGHARFVEGELYLKPTKF